MEMSEDEICSRFRRNGCYLRHIPILAQLNAVDDIACMVKLYESYDAMQEKIRSSANFSDGFIFRITESAQAV